MRFIELFAGIGGFRYGFEQTGKLECVWSNEWDKYANSIYKCHYGECDKRDIRTVNAKEIPDADMLVGGFPCQTFSIAGNRRGFEDTRGTLFFEIVRIAQEKRPSILLLENVKGLLNHEKGRTFGTILNTLDEIGYDAQWEVLNTKNFGIPQNRERVFIIATLRGTGFRQIFPIRQSNEISRKKLESQNICPTITSRYYKRGKTDPYIKTKKMSQGCRVMGIEGNSCTLTGLGDGAGAKTGLYAIPVSSPDRLEKHQNGRRFKENDDPMFTLTRQDKHGVYDGHRIRRLTPIECERLQGFPDNWTQYGCDRKEISDTQRYKCLGNAVSTNVIKEIAIQLIRKI